MEGGPVSLVTNFVVDDKYFRAIAKIGFHYVLKHLAFRGDEDEFAGIRKFIMEGGDISAFVSHSKEQIMEPAKWGMVTNIASTQSKLYSESGHAFVYYPDGPQGGFAGAMQKLEAIHPLLRFRA
jgi:hypothetical protein